MSGLNDNRSRSRGHDLISSGRGGVGNIRAAPTSPVAAQAHDDDTSNPRGREFVVSPNAMSSGRGGAGNIRSADQSRSPSAGGPTRSEKELIAKHSAMEAEAAHSLGRGGAGNITSPTSRSRSRGPNSASGKVLPPLHSSGRGGAGNITRLGDPNVLSNVEEAEIAKHHPIGEEPHPHSTGRGGLANITNLKEPHDAKDAPHSQAAGNQVHSSGRGGLGNIVTPDADGTSRGRERHMGPFASVLEKVRSVSSSATRGKAAPVQSEHAGTANTHTHTLDLNGAVSNGPAGWSGRSS